MKTQNQNNRLLFNKFQILQCLKKDIFSSVYIAHHVYLGKKILLKTLNTQEIPDSTWLERFKREAKILARLDHPNIIKILDFGSHAEQFYISFEYFESNNLRTFIRKTPLTTRQKYDIFMQISRGLVAAHNANIIHRDIKPENILINDAEKVKIADFGLAISTDEKLLTQKSSIVGTPAYMSPEQIKGDELTIQSDLFSLGIVGFEIFSGKNPFVGEDINQTINNILNVNWNNLKPYLKSIPTDMIFVIQKLLNPDPQERYQTTEEMLKKFDSIDKPVPSKKILFRLSYLIAPLVVLIIISALYFLQKDEEEMSPIASNVPINFPIDSPRDRSINPEKVKPSIRGNHSMLEQLKVPELSTPGKLKVESFPEAEFFVDSQKIESEYITLSAGQHLLELVHPAYPPYREIITIASGQEIHKVIKIDTLFGYFSCYIYPWGKLYIGEENYGQSPFFKPFRLNPGVYTIHIQNPNYLPLTDTLSIAKKETTYYKIDLDQLARIAPADSS
jgi:serine/threonine protein kinase